MKSVGLRTRAAKGCAALLLAAGLGLIFVGCARRADFVHYIADRPSQFVKYPHKLKELVGNNKVDVLWVVDNSISMGDHQQAVADNTQTFIEKFTKSSFLDWKMGIISSTENEPPYLGFPNGTLLDRTTLNPVDVFKAGIRRVGVNGSGYEKAYDPVRVALGRYPDFLRKDAVLAFIILTDAPEQSEMSSADFLAEMVRLKGGDGKKVIAYGAFAAMDFGCKVAQGETPWDYRGSKYEELVQKTNGKYFTLCGTGFGEKLANLGDDLVKRLASPRLALSERPKPSTIRVQFLGKDLPGGAKEQGGYWFYDFDLNSLVFHDLDFAKGDNEEVVISYDKAPKN